MVADRDDAPRSRALISSGGWGKFEMGLPFVLLGRLSPAVANSTQPKGGSLSRCMVSAPPGDQIEYTAQWMCAAFQCYWPFVMDSRAPNDDDVMI